jgi:two-component system alkaline phosphatase synthesis response regulator PhoP
MIYIVEDDENIRELEEYALSNSGYQVKGFSTGEELQVALKEKIPKIIILDIMLPGISGLEILKKLRDSHDTKTVPVLMITAKTSELDRVKGLDLGADDYLVKPFGVLEMVSRVKALLRRTNSEQSGNQYSYKEISVDDERHIVQAGNETLDLTYKEYELLKYLLANVNIVLSREKLMNHVWGFDYEGESRTVDMHIKTLRKKLGDSGDAIKTIRNVGYKIGD